MSADNATQDNFDEIIRSEMPKGLSLGHKVCFFCVALIASAFPAYLYYSKFFSVELSYYPVFIGVSLVCTILLALSYGKLTNEEFGNVMERRRKYGEEMGEAMGRKEAAAYAMFISNLLFEGMVVLLAFGILPRLSINLPTYVMYSVVSLLSGVVTFGFSYGFF